MNEIVESGEENLFFCTFFMFWSAKVVLLIDSLWHHHHHKRWEPLWVRRKSICHLFPIIKTFGSFIVLCGGYFCLPNKPNIEKSTIFKKFCKSKSRQITERSSIMKRSHIKSVTLLKKYTNHVFVIVPLLRTSANFRNFYVNKILMFIRQ